MPLRPDSFNTSADVATEVRGASPRPCRRRPTRRAPSSCAARWRRIPRRRRPPTPRRPRTPPPTRS
ncbi:hypothetical protein DD630_10885 [Streptomyces sp. BSE7F]|nr:hypothetical protein DD630_10885 [Streptomyces sp. BSE7F]